MAGGDFESFLEDFALHRLLAQQALQLLHLGLKRPVFGRRNDLLLGGRRRQCPLRRQLAPGEQLVRLNTVPTRDDAHRRVALIGLLNDRQLLCRAPTPPTFRTGQDFHLKNATSHITNITPTHLAKWGNMSGPFGGQFRAHRGTHVQFHIGDRPTCLDGPDGAVVVIEILQDLRGVLDIARQTVDVDAERRRKVNLSAIELCDLSA